MMYRKVIISADKKQIIELPDDYVGKSVEIIAFPIEEAKSTRDETKAAFKFWKSYSMDTSDFKFDGNEVNER